jgi:thioredoxin-related protein
MRRGILFILCLLITGTSFAQEKKLPYNENQDPRADLEKAITQAQHENKNILVQFGGNWCPWCMRFHALVTTLPKTDSIMKASYIYLLINVPREKDKRDYDLFLQFGNPDRFGFPVFVILDKNGKRLNTQDSDAFEYPNPKIQGYDTAKVERFLSLWTVKAVTTSMQKKK